MLRPILASIFLASVHSFYLPGVAPQDFERGQEVELKVNSLDSVHTQLPIDYYSLPFCRPDTIEPAAENFGEVLSGDLIETSPYQIQMRIEKSCKVVCQREYTDEEFSQLANAIQNEYRVNWIIDNMPAATRFYITDKSDSTTGQVHYEKGFPLGFSENEVRYVNNHVRLIVHYHEDPASFVGSRIVGFEVEPVSVHHKVMGEYNDKQPEDTKLETCTSGATPLAQPALAQAQAVSGKQQKDQGNKVVWSYDITWKASPIKWASRWDLYLQTVDSEIHWFSIFNSIMMVLFLSGMVAMIMLRTLNQDLRRYNDVEISDETQQEESGWKLIHAEVFRPPNRAGSFAVLVGTGAQVLAMTILTLIFAVLGFLSPANRGGLLTALLLIYVFMGIIAGYASTRMITMFKIPDWKTNTLWTALFFPGVLFTGFFILNLFVWGAKSSGAVPFSTLVALLVLWLGISVPLVYMGSYIALQQKPIEPPVKVNKIPRLLLPAGAWYNSPYFSVLLGGVLPFGACFIEIFFIMSSVWLHQFYYVFGFLFIVFVVLVISCAEISIVMCYFQLCSENYHWWWRSYFTSGASAFYLFAYSVVYFFTKLEITNFVSGLLFFGYMALVSIMFFVLTGTIGAIACYMFVRKIYSSVKVD